MIPARTIPVQSHQGQNPLASDIESLRDAAFKHTGALASIPDVSKALTELLAKLRDAQSNMAEVARAALEQDPLHNKAEEVAGALSNAGFESMVSSLGTAYYSTREDDTGKLKGQWIDRIVITLNAIHPPDQWWGQIDAFMKERFPGLAYEVKPHADPNDFR